MSTPMIRQYRALKAAHQDAILLYRLGDFYEMFEQDARDGARILGLTLTRRQEMAMCGVPHHAAHAYIGRLLRAGRKVAICEQVGSTSQPGITEREVVEVLTPGAVFESDFLDPGRNNYLLSVGSYGKSFVAAWCDVSTGEFVIYAKAAGETELSIEAQVRRLVAMVEPREALVQESIYEALQSRVGQPVNELFASSAVVERVPDWAFDAQEARARLADLLGTRTLAGFGIDDSDDAPAAAAPLLDYLERNAQRTLRHIRSVQRSLDDALVILDDASVRNLELVAAMRDGSQAFSLLSVIDETTTMMGKRRMRRRVLAPVSSIDLIDSRLDRVERLYRDQTTLAEVRAILHEVHDLERLIGRLGVDKAHPKDLLAISQTIRSGRQLDRVVTYNTLVPETRARELEALAGEIAATLVDDPPISVSEGGVCRDGIDPQLDEARSLRGESGDHLDLYLAEQREATGITSLKIKYNRMLGHFFEVPSSAASRVPDSFIQRQSLAQAVRFTTPYLSQLESRINHAAELAIAREQELFLALRERARNALPLLAELADALAELDVEAGLARVATLRGYRRPTLVEEPVLDLVGARHPVVEAHLRPGEFVANDTALATPDAPRFALVTGPNMAGKSTVLRQTALIVLMAHIGSFVPADEARVGRCDRIFCRVGASDNIARGESTFLVEMHETASILHNATERSLIIMDEVGRGTSTHDGLAIAWAVTEYLLEHVRARTLFATHYHELGALSHPDFRPLRMQVEHGHDSIVFLNRLVPGLADRSYGVDVARTAGLPAALIERARSLLAVFEADGRTTPAELPPARTAAEPVPDSPDLFAPEQLLAAEVRSLDPENLTPRQALDLVYRWSRELGSDR